MQDIEIPSSGELPAVVLQCSLQSIHSLHSILSSSFINKCNLKEKISPIRDGSVVLYLRVLWSEAMSWVKKVNKSYLHFWTFRPKLSQERTLSCGRNSNGLLKALKASRATKLIAENLLTQGTYVVLVFPVELNACTANSKKCGLVAVRSRTSVWPCCITWLGEPGVGPHHIRAYHCTSDLVSISLKTPQPRPPTRNLYTTSIDTFSKRLIRTKPGPHP